MSANFGQLIRHLEMPHIRFHDLRHPYVKHTTKKYNSEKQKTQGYQDCGFDSLGFCFLFRLLFKAVMDLVNNLNAVVGEYIYLFNQQIGQLGS